jgi:hypothetical protein
MPNARLHTIAGAGHLVLLDEPTRAAPVIVEFLEFGMPPRTAHTGNAVVARPLKPLRLVGKQVATAVSRQPGSMIGCHTT